MKRKRKNWTKYLKRRGRCMCHYRSVKSCRRTDVLPYSERVPHKMHPGTAGRNKMDPQTNTCCKLELDDYAKRIYEVAPFLDSKEPVKEVMVAQCWTSPCGPYLETGSQMEHSLINPNQIREYGIPLCDNPFTTERFGIDTDEAFVPFNTTGTIVYFES